MRSVQIISCVTATEVESEGKSFFVAASSSHDRYEMDLK